MSNVQVLESVIDSSINFVEPYVDGGFLESRFVQRRPDTFIVYLSSMTGCDKACRFCHLTQTGQTTMTQTTFQEYLTQARQVLNLAKARCDINLVENIHFNFMARGDILNNNNFKSNPYRFITSLEKLGKQYFPNATCRFKISTIFPKDVGEGVGLIPSRAISLLMYSINELRDECGVDVELYYSLYSLDEAFRRKWLPKALDPNEVGDTLRGTHEGLRLHHALIAGQNDRDEDVDDIHQWLEEHDLKVMINIVRYNSANDRCGSESGEAARNRYIEQLNKSNRVLLVKEIPFAGRDVYASCGMFVK